MLLNFFFEIFVYFGQMDPIKVQVLELSTACMKINQINHFSSHKSAFVQTLQHPLVS